MAITSGEDAESAEYDENKYHRVRVIREKDGVYECYLPDHGDHEKLSRNQLREIDPDLNASLPYQATMAKLHLLDNLPVKYLPLVTEMLIRMLVNSSTTFYAVKAGRSAVKRDDATTVDPTIVQRVRKIISVVPDADPDKLKKVYLGVYNVALENPEEVVKHIPGYGYWKESLEIDLYDTTDEEEDININETILVAISKMEEAESKGQNPREAMHEILGSSSTSQAETESASAGDGTGQGVQFLQSALDKLSLKLGGDSEGEAKLERVRDYVRDVQENANGAGKRLYTWGVSPEAGPNESKAQQPEISGADSTVSACETVSSADTPAPPPSLPGYWQYHLVSAVYDDEEIPAVSIHITQADSPSTFVAVPMEQMGALRKMEDALTQAFSSVEVAPAPQLSAENVYAVKDRSSGQYRRALYEGNLACVVKVFFPDHHCFDTVNPDEIFPLPEQFYSLPFLAYRMRLGGVAPSSADWDDSVRQWFDSSFRGKNVFAYIYSEDHSGLSSSPQAHSKTTGSGRLRIPPVLVVRLVDTSGEDDVIVDDYMVETRRAVRISD